MATRIAAAVSGLTLAACSVVGVRDGTEEPHFDVRERIGMVVIRAYGPRLAAETVVEADESSARNAGFRRLAGYIFGGNSARTKIAMTAPVAVQPASEPGEKIAMTVPVAQAQDASGAWRIRFFLPAGLAWETLPVPHEAHGELVKVAAETIAVLPFTGDRGAEAVAAKQAILLQTLEKSSWRPIGAPVAWFYDPPWTLPWLRRNEVAVPVAAR